MVAANSVEHTYKYPFESRLTGPTDSPKLQLATSESANQFPHFFDGVLLYPATTARFLTTVAKVVSTRFYIPPNMLDRFLLERDPVVTVGGGVLRFEGFSACCSTYARVDVNPDGYRGQFVGSGTTNVDFNQPMRDSLARIRNEDHLSLTVGPDEVQLRHGFEKVIERKVKLPLRWLKGFVEIQAYQSQMELRYELSKVEAIRFLRSMPRSTPIRASFYVVSAGKTLRLSQVFSPDAVVISGLQRLRLLQDLALFADKLRIYTNASQSVSEWQLHCGPIVISMAITADVSRGFSGEGQVLTHLASSSEQGLGALRAALKWQSIIDEGELSASCGIPIDEVKNGLARLGSRGLVGYDLARGAYFHRELPFDMDLVEEMHPRLEQARKIIATGGLRVVASGDDTFEASVAGTQTEHRVVIGATVAKCTCPWYAKYQGTRGPCKHVIAAQLHLDQDEAE